MKESGVLDKTTLVFGQMNEPPGARQRVALWLLPWPNISATKQGRAFVHRQHFPFHAGRIGSVGTFGTHFPAVGYQLTLAEEMGKLQERITSTKNGLITSVQATYVPADDLNGSGAGDNVRASRFDSRAFQEVCPSLNISCGGSAGFELDDFGSEYSRTGAL